MIALAFALALFVPGPNDPVCETGQSVQVDHCAQGQLPGEVIGRQIDAPPAPTPTAATDPASIVLAPTVPAAVAPVPSTHLAHTGVPAVPYLAVSATLIGAGVLLRRVTRQTPTPLAAAAQSAD